MDLLSNSDLFSKIQVLIEQKIKDTINRKLDELKIQISKLLTDEEIRKVGMNLSKLIDEVGQTQLSALNVNLRVFPIRKNRLKKEIDEEVRCMARIGLGSQCTRSRGEHNQYCKSHATFLPYGRIDGPLEQKAIKPLGKKRGRRFTKSASKNYQLEDLDLDCYVQASIVQIDGMFLIQDEHGMLYRHDQTNQIIGRATDDGIEWY